MNAADLPTWLLAPCLIGVLLCPPLLRTLARLAVAHAAGLEAGSAAFAAAFKATFEADPCARQRESEAKG